MALTKVSYGVITADASSADLNIDANTLFVDSSANRVGIVNNSPTVALDVTGEILTSSHIKIGGSNNELRFYEGSNYVGFEAPALSADKIWVLPAADGSNGQLLTTNGSGVLAFSDPASGGVSRSETFFMGLL